MAGAAHRRMRGLLLLAICQRAVLATDCPAGAAPFPSDLANTGTVQHANLFSVTYHDTYKVISYSPTLSTYAASHPNKPGESIPEIVLYQCGTPKPEPTDAGISGSGVRFFEIPLQRATLPWAGALPFFELLSVTEHIFSMDFTYVSSSCAQLMEECLPSLHVSQYESASVAANESVVFTDSFGTGASHTAWDVEFQVSLDPGILNRAEWVSFVSFFFNLESEASAIFSKMEADYDALKSMGAQLGADESTEWGGRKPLLLWVTSTTGTTCDNPEVNCLNTAGWLVLDGSWCKCEGVRINNANYKTNLVQDAGGQMVSIPATAPAGCSRTSNTDGAVTLSCGGTAGIQSFKVFLAEADVIVDETSTGYDTTAHDFEATFFVTPQEVPALARTPINIFTLDGTVSDGWGQYDTQGSAWHNTAKAQPQQLLAGMMEMLWGDSFESPCGLKYFRRAVSGEGQTVVGHEDCPYHDEGGNHDCAAIHEHEHEVPQCMPSSTPAPPTTTPNTEVTSAAAAGVQSSTPAPITTPNNEVSSAAAAGVQAAFFLPVLGLAAQS